MARGMKVEIFPTRHQSQHQINVKFMCVEK